MVEKINRFTITSVAVPLLLAVTILSSATFLFYFGELDLLLSSSYVIVAFLFVLPLAYRYREISSSGFEGSGRRMKMLSMTVFFLMVTGAIAVLRVLNYRSIGFFIFITVTGAAIFVQIKGYNGSSRLRAAILLQLSIYITLIIYSLSLRYWYFVGGTDIVNHVRSIQLLLAQGNIPNSSIYSQFPLWYILIAIITKFTQISLPTHRVVFLTSGLVFSTVPIITYIVAARITSCYQKRLLSAMFVTINITVIYYGVYSIPRSIVLVLLLIVIYLLFSTHDWRTVSLFALLSSTIVMYHPSSPPFILSLFVAVYLARIIYEIENISISISRFGPLLGIFFIFVTAYWVFYADVMVQAIVTALYFSPPSVSGFSTQSPTVLEQIKHLWEFIPYSILLGLILYAVMVPLSSTSVNNIEKYLIIVGLGVAALSFPNPLLIIDKFQQWNFDRWGIYTPAFVSIASAIGLVELSRRLPTSGRHLLTIVIIVLIFTSLLNPTIAADNPQIGSDTATPYLTESETTGIKYATNHTASVVMGDYTTTRYISGPQTSTDHILLLDPETNSPIVDSTPHFILIRSSELENRGIEVIFTEEYTYRPGFKGRVTLTDNVVINPDQYEKVYSGEGTTGYIKN